MRFNLSRPEQPCGAVKARALPDHQAHEPALAVFNRLDGRAISQPGSTWHLAIYSIVDTPEDRWLQIGLSDGTCAKMVTVRVSPETRSEQLLKQIGASIAPPGTEPWIPTEQVASLSLDQLYE
jgi:hypothetical protein